MSKIKVNEIEAQSGSTITIPTGQNLVVTDGIGTSSLPTIPVSKGGTGLTSLGTAGQAIKVNSGATALEFGTISSGNVYQARATATQASSSTSYIALTDLSFNVTPPSTSTKYLVIAITYANINSTQGWSTQLKRDSTVLYTQRNSYALYQGAGGDHEQNIFMYVDSPNTTSQFTYSLEGRAHSSSNNVSWNDGDYSTLTAVEIG